VRISSTVSLVPVKHSKTEKASLTGVDDAFYNASNVLFASVVDTDEAQK
jgi:hypothetical protein